MKGGLRGSRRGDALRGRISPQGSGGRGGSWPGAWELTPIRGSVGGSWPGVWELTPVGGTPVGGAGRGAVGGGGNCWGGGGTRGGSGGGRGGGLDAGGTFRLRELLPETVLGVRWRVGLGGRVAGFCPLVVLVLHRNTGSEECTWDVGDC